MNPATAPEPRSLGPTPSATAPAQPGGGAVPAGARPLRVGTRGSPLALIQTRGFIALFRGTGATLRDREGSQEDVIRTTGDAVQDRRLADIGGKGLFAKEIHEALAGHRIDCRGAQPQGPGNRSAARHRARLHAIAGGRARRSDPAHHRCRPDRPRHPFAALPAGATVGTASLRRQAQLLHARPDLHVMMLRGNVQTRLDKLAAGYCDAPCWPWPGCAGLVSPIMPPWRSIPTSIVPAAGQGIVGITVRADDTELRDLACRHRGPGSKRAPRTPSAACSPHSTAPAGPRSAPTHGATRTACCT